MVVYDSPSVYDTPSLYDAAVAGMGWFPQFQLLIAFNNGVFDDPALITTTATPAGTLGANNVWTDVTADVRDNVDTNRGKQHEVDKFQPGTLACTFDNRTGRYDQWNTTGPYTGKITPGRPVQLRATDPNTGAVAKLYTGFTDVWASVWSAPGYATVQLSCVDWLAYLVNLYPSSNYYQSVVLGDSPTGFWRLNDAYGSTTAADLGSGAHNATVKGGTAIFGQAAGPAAGARATAVILGVGQGGGYFDHWGHGYFTSAWLSSAGVINPVGTDFSIEAWVQVNNAPLERNFVWSQPSTGLYLYVDTSTGKAGWTSTFDESGTTNICDTKWHHLVLTNVFATTTQNLYVDGVLQTTVTNAAPAFTDTRSLIGSPGENQAGFGGNIADVAIYPAALTAAQVAAHYAAAALSTPVESSGSVITRIINAVGMPTANANIDTGKSQLQASTLASTTTGLSFMQIVEQTELGALFIDGTGQFRFMSRDTVYTSLTSTAAFGDGNQTFLTANQMSLESGTTTGWAANLRCTISSSTLQAFDGTHSLAMTSTSAGDMDAVTPLGLSGFPVVAGVTYTASVQTRAATAARSVSLGLGWYDSGGSFIINTFGVPVTNSTTGWTRVSVSANPPAGAAFVGVIPYVTANGGTGEVHYFDLFALGGEIPFELGPTIAVDTLDLYTTVLVQRVGGQLQTATAGGVGKTLNLSGLLQTGDTECLGMANWLLAQFSVAAKPRIRKVTIHPFVTSMTGAATTAVLGLDLMSVVTINRHTLPGGGTGFTQIANVEGINHHIYPATGDWNVDLQLTPLPPLRPWILGTSQLGVDTNLFF